MVDRIIGISEKVKKSAVRVNHSTTKSVSFNEKAFVEQIDKFSELSYPSWHKCHNLDSDVDIEELIYFILCVDSVNFCFWPYEKQSDCDFEYNDMTEGFRRLMKHFDRSSKFYKAESLIALNEENLVQLKIFPQGFPLLDERARSLNDLGRLMLKFNDTPSEIMKYCNNDCEAIAEFLIKELSTFRDEAIYKGRQVFMYKRAQIAAADMSAALSERGLVLKNVEILTMFPDYRVPQILNEMGILQYNDELLQKIKEKVEINAATNEEIELRLMTVFAVEEMKRIIKDIKGKSLTSVEIDYILWNEGEKLRKDIVPHHRCLTIFY